MKLIKVYHYEKNDREQVLFVYHIDLLDQYGKLIREFDTDWEVELFLAGAEWIYQGGIPVDIKKVSDIDV